MDRLREMAAERIGWLVDLVFGEELGGLDLGPWLGSLGAVDELAGAMASGTPAAVRIASPPGGAARGGAAAYDAAALGGVGALAGQASSSTDGMSEPSGLSAARDAAWGSGGDFFLLGDDYNPNCPPYAYGEGYVATHDSTLEVYAPGILENDWDPDGDDIYAVLVTGPSHADYFSLASDGSFTYTPVGGFVGEDGFTYQVSDGVNLSEETATCTIGVFNCAPVVEDDIGEYLTGHDCALEVSDESGVLANDYDPDGDPMTAVLETGPSHAAAFSLNPGGGFYYEPEYHWVGTDTFTYRATDGLEASDVATVEIGVMNMAPIAEDDIGEYLTGHDCALEVSDESGVLANDYDFDGDPMTAVLETGPSHAAAFSLNPGGGFYYEPEYHWVGTDTFTYRATDGLEPSEVATVEIGVMNMSPMAEDDSYETLHICSVHNTPLEVAAPGVMENDWDDDGDPITASLVTGPSHAQSFILSSDGSFTYTPTYHYVGTDTFTYRVNDQIDDSNIATVTIDVMNMPPWAEDDPPPGGEAPGSYIVVYNTELEVAEPGVLENDWDSDGDYPLVVAGLETLPAHGSVDLHPNGSFEYTPNMGYEGADSFHYRATDGLHVSEPAMVSLTVVRPVPDIDTDSNNNGVIDGTQEEDDDDMVAPGRLLWHNIDDDNNNGTPDREEAPLLDGQGNPVIDNELRPATLAIDPQYADLTGFTLELTRSPNLRLFASEAKANLDLTYTIGTDTIPSTIYVEGYDLGQGQADWILRNPAGIEVNRDSVLFTVVYVNLTAYRPQTEGYGSPFARTAIPIAQEESPGAGIRRNGDDDDENATPDWQDPSVTGENDLIEVDVHSRPILSPGVGYRLERSAPPIRVWGSSSKGNLYLDSDDPTPIAGGDFSMWVEYNPAGSGGSDLSYTVWDTTHNRRVFWGDTIHFYPFTSVVIAFGGWDAVPLDVNSGPFQMAIDLYARGYDVHAYNERTLDQPNPTAAHREVISAVDERGVQQVAIFGHSYGGGGVYELLTRLGATPPQGSFIVPFTAYIDGIVWNSLGGAETRLPPGTQYHVNYWQSYTGYWYDLNGAPVPGANFNLDVRSTAWGAALVHTTIDNDLTVRTRVLDGSTAGGTEGPHAGLTQRVSR